MNFGDFEEFCENTKQKTDLTQWMLAIKANPKDPNVYLILADWLGDRGGFDEMMGTYLRSVVGMQYEEASNGLKIPLSGDYGVSGTQPKQENIAKMSEAISQRFAKLGIGAGTDPRDPYVDVPKKLTQHHRLGNLGLPRDVRMRNAKSIAKMAITIDQEIDRPGYTPEDEEVWGVKRRQPNNVAYQDLSNRNMQLYGIFLIAQKIATNLLILAGNEQDECKENGYIDLLYILNHWMTRLHLGDSNYVLTVRNYMEILPYLKQSWNCCPKFNDDSVSGLAWQLNRLGVLEGLDLHRFNNWAANRIVSRWLDAIAAWRVGGCPVYRQQISSIIKDFRNRRQAHIRFENDT